MAKKILLAAAENMIVPAIENLARDTTRGLFHEINEYLASGRCIYYLSSYKVNSKLMHVN